MSSILVFSILRESGSFGKLRIRFPGKAKRHLVEVPGPCLLELLLEFFFGFCFEKLYEILPDEFDSALPGHLNPFFVNAPDSPFFIREKHDLPAI
jgi:hypothetical protein